MSEFMKQLHFDIQQKFKESNAKYQQDANQHRREQLFDEGDYVMVYLRPKHFPVCTYGKLEARKIGPCRIQKKINDNVYEVDLPSGWNISPVFNVCDLYKYHSSEFNNFQPGEDDANLNIFVAASQPSLSSLGSSTNGQFLKSKMKQQVLSPMQQF